MKSILVLLLIAGSAVAQDAGRRDYAQACGQVFTAASATMLGAGFRPTVSDSAGGLLALEYGREPVVYAFMVKHATPYLEKYAAQGARRKYNGFTYTDASYTFVPKDGGGCQVELKVGIAALDLRPDYGSHSRWKRVQIPLAGNGTAETEFLDQIAGRLGKQ